MAAIITPNRSAARPDRIAWAIISAPTCTSPASPALASKTPPRAAQTDTIGPLLCPVRTRITSATSSALPRLGTKGWLMSLITAVVRHPLAFAVLVNAVASACACARSFIKAPLPTLTSNTKPSSPAASFFDRIDAVIKSRLSTVEETSRTA